ncbi:type II toxin-antitoxin system ParD family antitoxin [Pectobacterium parvum]|nr:type II toxin-antitoxin system ParD family antitoxin [Pectobacterium parvum]UFK37645.1 type II toxin-antitoxin system ParD family antitoxin [Pectobacterium parvum]GKW40523.1 hypothetical protein PEC301879_03820 [Pectobacterium carotovorum subsp. carotovorum]
MTGRAFYVITLQGLRWGEVAKLDIYSVDGNRKTVTVRQGKGRKDRLVPIGGRALRWLSHYQHQVRPQLLVSQDIIALSPYFEQFIREQIESGRYNNVSEVIRAGLRALSSTEDLYRQCCVIGDTGSWTFTGDT